MQAFVHERQDWIQKTFSRLYQNHKKQSDEIRSRENELLLRGEWLPISVKKPRPEAKKWLLVERNPEVHAYPPGLGVDTEGGVYPGVPEKTEFLRKLAKTELPQRFEEVASALGFKWNRFFIRSQKTKWGTCSTKGNISLNWRLIMCPPEIVDYIIIHELCHTVHMNHSKAFWELLRTYYPETDKAHKWLREHGNIPFLIG